MIQGAYHVLAQIILAKSYHGYPMNDSLLENQGAYYGPRQIGLVFRTAPQVPTLEYSVPFCRRVADGGVTGLKSFL